MGKAVRDLAFDFAKVQKRAEAEAFAWMRQNKSGIGNAPSVPGFTSRDLGGGNNKDPNKLSLTGGIMINPIAYRSRTIIISAGNVAQIDEDASGDPAEIPGIVHLNDATTGTLDEMLPNKHLADVIYLINRGTGNITITHASLNAGQFLCPGDVNFTLGVDEVAIAVMNDTQSPIPTWHLFGGTAGGGGLTLTTQGDLHTFSTVDIALAVGTNGQFLQADSAEATGLKWVTSSATEVPLWTEDHDTDGYNLIIDFDANSALIMDRDGLVGDNELGIALGSLASLDYLFKETDLDMFNSTISNLGGFTTTFGHAMVVTATEMEFISATGTDLEFDTVGSGDDIEFRIANVLKMVLSNTSFDIQPTVAT